MNNILDNKYSFVLPPTVPGVTELVADYMKDLQNQVSIELLLKEFNLPATEDSLKKLTPLIAAIYNKACITISSKNIDVKTDAINTIEFNTMQAIEEFKEKYEDEIYLSRFRTAEIDITKCFKSFKSSLNK